MAYIFTTIQFIRANFKWISSQTLFLFSKMVKFSTMLLLVCVCARLSVRLYEYVRYYTPFCNGNRMVFAFAIKIILKFSCVRVKLNALSSNINMLFGEGGSNRFFTSKMLLNWMRLNATLWSHVVLKEQVGFALNITYICAVHISHWIEWERN